MAIVKMKRLRLAGMKQDREELLDLLQRMGCVEIDEPSPEPDDPNWARLTRPVEEGLSDARDGRSAAERALEVLKRYAPEKKGMLTPKPELTVEELLTADMGAAQSQTEVINGLDGRMAVIRADITKKQTEIGTLTPWKALDLPLESGSTAQVKFHVGTLPAVADLAQVRQEIQAAGDLAELTAVSADRERHYLLLLCHASQESATMDVLKAFGWSRAGLRAWEGTAAENISRLEGEITALEQELARIEGQLAGMGESRTGIRVLSDRYETQEFREENLARSLDTEQVFFLEGWVSEENWPGLERALAAYPAAAEVEDPVEEEYAQVPVQLKNNWLTRPLNMVTDMYALPTYGTVDPNPLMAPFFIFFYGFMMADMGYGILMMLASFIILKKAKPDGPTMRHMIPLLGLCGVSTFIMGALTGGFFGDFLTKLFGILDPGHTIAFPALLTGADGGFALPALFSPLEDALAVLIGSLAIGVTQIFTGMGVSMYRKIKKGQVMDALCSEGAWYLVFVLLAGGILLGQVKTALIAIVVLLVLTQGYGKKGVAGKLMGIGGSLYNNVTGYFSDILSYSRLMALMLAGAVIAQVFNTLGALTGNVILFFIISMVGNALNFALNLLGCYVHDMRLQCLEYFGRFYEDGGKPFRPLELKTKYYHIVK